MELDLSSIYRKLDDIQPVKVYGRVTKVVGLTVESEGPPVSIGEIILMDDIRQKTPFQVIGFNNKKVLSMPLGDVTGIYPGQRLYSTEKYPGLNIDESFLGRVINGRGEPIDGKGELIGKDYIYVYKKPVNAMEREPISEVLSTGIRADGNNVNIESEMLKLTENNIQYNVAVHLTAKKLSGLKEAIREAARS